ncbi:hypothetical protein BMS3Bbin11_00320 [bacterium BMS3Bbin11]|nr:hypothetical protein BMS3Bbin11_00320 [bacterium BMS3Bbin11]
MSAALPPSRIPEAETVIKKSISIPDPLPELALYRSMVMIISTSI